MEKERIRKAAQLADDHKKINRALGLFENSEKVGVRLSANVGGGNNEDTLFAWLPKSIVPAIYELLLTAKEYTEREMEDL